MRDAQEYSWYLGEGPHPTREGICFALQADPTAEVTLVIYKKGTTQILKEIPVSADLGAGHMRMVKVEGFKSSTIEYNYRVDGQIVQDPAARVIVGRKQFGETPNQEEGSVRCGFFTENYIWGGDQLPRIPYEDVISYGLHVRGFTKSRSSKVRHKGTFKGIVEKIPYFKSLGINQLILMPAYDFNELPKESAADPQQIHVGQPHRAGQAAGSTANVPASDGSRVVDSAAANSVPGDPTRTLFTGAGQAEPVQKQVNYWGYTDGFYFAPKESFAATSRPDVEFRDMVRALHEAGIELIMEFAFHDEVPVLYVTECLRWWVSRYHVDGFRLMVRPEVADLAAQSPFLKEVKLMTGWYDPKRLQHKHLADCGDGFATPVRRLLKSDEGQLQTFVDLLRRYHTEKGTMNYITSHDGFTLMDLVSYERKHNEANGQDNKDGAESEFSWNCGAEGPTRKRSIGRLRIKQMKNAFAMLLLAEGTPVILAGDEFGNSQEGNSNPWCIDSEVTWVDWKGLKTNHELFLYVKELIALRRKYRILHPGSERGAMSNTACGYPDFSCHSEKAWFGQFDYQSRQVGTMFCGRQDGEDTFLYAAFNFHWEEKTFALPYLPKDMSWVLLEDTTGMSLAQEGSEERFVRDVTAPGRSVMILTAVKHQGEAKSNNKNTMDKVER